MIIFHSPTLLDLRCLRAFGVSVKPMTDTPIGVFGSGLKGALSLLLRLKHAITLYIGLDRYTFQTKAVTIRGKAFDFVVLVHPDGREEELAFNTHVWEHVEPWCGFRELHSNALDEGGNTYAAPDSLPYTPKENETAFVVQGPDIEAAYAARHEIFLSSSPFYATERVQVHRGQSNYVYYRGVRVLKLTRPSLFTYNLVGKVDLTEDRTLKNGYDLDIAVTNLIAQTDNAEILGATLVAADDFYEHHLYQAWVEGQPGDAFMSAYSAFRTEGRLVDLTSFATTLYLKRQPHLPIPEPITLNRVQTKQLAKAIAFCRGMGWTVDEYPIVTVAQQRSGLMAWAQDRTIVVTQAAFDKGTVEVAACLYEEFLHLKHGFRDHSRELQNFLFQTVMKLGQELAGEPL